MNTLEKIIKNIKNEKIINIIKIILNIWIFFIISKIIDIFYSYDDKIKYYYKKVPFICTIKWKKIIYFFQLNSFIELYEENEFLDLILNSKMDVFIDIWANILRISSLVSSYNSNFKKIIALEPNKNCLDKSLNYIPNIIKKNIIFLNYWLWNETKTSEMTINKHDSATTMWTLNKEKSALKNLDKKDSKIIDVKILSFEDFFKENNLNNYKTFFLKIDVEWYEEFVFKSFFNFLEKNKWLYDFKIIFEVLHWNEDLFDKLETFWVNKNEISRIWEWCDYLFNI